MPKELPEQSYASPNMELVTCIVKNDVAADQFFVIYTEER